MPAQEKGHTAVVLKAMGRAINKTVTIGARGPIALWQLSMCRTQLASLLPWVVLHAAGTVAARAQHWVAGMLADALSRARQPRSSSGASRGCTRTPRSGPWT